MTFCKKQYFLTIVNFLICPFLLYFLYIFFCLSHKTVKTEAFFNLDE